jgi:hypothetical protein
MELFLHLANFYVILRMYSPASALPCDNLLKIKVVVLVAEPHFGSRGVRAALLWKLIVKDNM